MTAAYIIIAILTALMLAGSIAAVTRAGEKEGICKYDRDDVRRDDNQ